MFTRETLLKLIFKAVHIAYKKYGTREAITPEEIFLVMYIT